MKIFWCDDDTSYLILYGRVLWRSVIKPYNSMEQSPSWQANNSSDGQEIPRILWNPRLHYCVHKNPPLVPIMSLLGQIHMFTPYFFKKYFDRPIMYA
jgi:hypothetical protein